MNTIFEPIDHGVIANTRNTFSARLLTDPQFEEFVSICMVLHREVHRSGSFIEKLETYAFAISRTEKGINASKAETIIRDLFKCLFGQTMDQVRKALLKTEEELGEEALALGHDYALATLKQVEEGDKIPFYRAYAEQAALMATELMISDITAKKIIGEAFEEREGRPFYEEGKLVEDRFYAPQIKAEKRKREQRQQSQRRGRSFARATGQVDNPELAESLGIGAANVGGDYHHTGQGE